MAGDDNEMFMIRSLNVMPKQTEQRKLTARSDKSVAYVTNSKRLRSTFCTIEANYWQTRSIVQPYCDSRVNCSTLVLYFNWLFCCIHTVTVCRVTSDIWDTLIILHSSSSLWPADGLLLLIVSWHFASQHLRDGCICAETVPRMYCGSRVNVKVEEEHVCWSLLRTYTTLHNAADDARLVLLRLRRSQPRRRCTHVAFMASYSYDVLGFHIKVTLYLWLYVQCNFFQSFMAAAK